MPNSKRTLPSPWQEFLKELDALVPQPVEAHCIGGFVVSVFYGLPRPTGDIDYYSIQPLHAAENLQKSAGPESPLAQKYKIHVQHVTVNNLPENYESRLEEMFPGSFTNLHLFTPDPYDLILSKLERNSSKDRDDAEYLATTLKLKPEVLRERYNDELRPYLSREEWHDRTLDMWVKSLFVVH